MTSEELDREAEAPFTKVAPKDKIKIEIFREGNFYIANLNNGEYATQGKSLEELFFMIWDLIGLAEIVIKKDITQPNKSITNVELDREVEDRIRRIDNIKNCNRKEDFCLGINRRLLLEIKITLQAQQDRIKQLETNQSKKKIGFSLDEKEINSKIDNELLKENIELKKRIKQLEAE